MIGAGAKILLVIFALAFRRILKPPLKSRG